MNFLLDTNVVSEGVKPQPNPRVITWLSDVDEDRVFLSVVTLAELRHGIDRLPSGRRRERLDEWLTHELRGRFEDRILPIDESIADAWGTIVAKREQAGRPVGVMDAFVAATAYVHDLTLVTRNAAHFASSVTHVFDPWTDAP